MKAFFFVDQNGQIKIDFLYDGGQYTQGEVGIFSLKGMDLYETGSEGFIREAVRRATSNSTDGYVVVKDAEESALYSDDNNILYWEPNFNGGAYQGEKTYEMNAGDAFGFVLTSNGSLDDVLTGERLTNYNRPIFSMSAANLNNNIQVADVLTGSQGTIIGFEDVVLQNGSNRDYNDFVIALEGVQSIGISNIENVMAHYHNWVNTGLGNEILNHFNSDILLPQISQSVMTGF